MKLYVLIYFVLIKKRVIHG